jgi:hypothetical protein
MIFTEVDDVILEFILDYQKRFFLHGKILYPTIKVISARSNTRIFFPDFNPKEQPFSEVQPVTLEGSFENIQKAVALFEQEALNFAERFQQQQQREREREIENRERIREQHQQREREREKETETRKQIMKKEPTTATNTNNNSGNNQSTNERNELSDETTKSSKAIHNNNEQTTNNNRTVNAIEKRHNNNNSSSNKSNNNTNNSNFEKDKLNQKNDEDNQKQKTLNKDPHTYSNRTKTTTTSTPVNTPNNSDISTQPTPINPMTAATNINNITKTPITKITRSIDVPSNIVGLLLSKKSKVKQSVMNQIQQNTRTLISKVVTSSGTDSNGGKQLPNTSTTDSDRRRKKFDDEEGENDEDNNLNLEEEDDEDEAGIGSEEDEEENEEEPEDESTAQEPEEGKKVEVTGDEPPFVEFKIVGSSIEAVNMAYHLLERIIAGERIKDVMESLAQKLQALGLGIADGGVGGAHIYSQRNNAPYSYNATGSSAAGYRDRVREREKERDRSDLHRENKPPREQDRGAGRDSWRDSTTKSGYQSRSSGAGGGVQGRGPPARETKEGDITANKSKRSNFHSGNKK